jgi:molybdopterin-guanine dinucleotide biosynthesis protein A
VTTVLLVVAAGRGQRMSGPKALLLIDGRPLAELHAGSHDNVVIVTSKDIERALGPIARFVAPDRAPELGPAGSIGAAVRSGALDDADAVIVTPVDVLPAPRALLDALVSALGDHEAARPSRGHPAAVRGAVLRERYREADPILRDVLAAVTCARLQEAGVLDDLDTPEDVVRMTGAGPVFLVR